MKTLNRIADLEGYGLSYLTAEACALSQRLLFDMNEDGLALMQEYFGMPPIYAGSIGSQFAPAWNNTVNGKPAVASILLPKNPEFYQNLYKFLLFREGHEIVMMYADMVTGMSETDLKEVGFESLTGTLHRNPRIPNQPSAGTHNVHAMSGRSD